MSDLGEELIDAVMDGDLDPVKDLIEQGVDVNYKDDYGNTALMTASRYGYFDIVKILIENNADIHIQGSNRINALNLSARGGFVEIVDYLIKHGADVHSNDDDVLFSAISGNLNIVEYLIIENRMVISDKTISRIKENMVKPKETGILASFINVDKNNYSFTLDLIAKRDFEKQLQQEIKPIQEKKAKTNTGKL